MSGTSAESAADAPETARSHTVTRLLEDMAGGDSAAKDRLLEEVYHVLHAIADRRAQHETPRADLDATSLVNEAYVKVFGSGPVNFENRRHLYGVFALAMREVLVDAARHRGAKKRSGKHVDIPLSGLSSPAPAEFQDTIRLDCALPQLERIDSRASEVVRLKCFAGLSDRQIAEVTGISERSVQREWNFARAFLKRVIARRDDDGT